MTSAYVHGYDARENLRLQDQAATLEELLHSDTLYPAGSSVLEAGCGVGAQTVALASNSPRALITSIDISAASLAAATAAIQAAGIQNVTLREADIFHLPFAPGSFDYVFVCFVLEHLSQPVEALRALKSVLKPGGTITVIEGDHGSTFFYPDSEYARRAVLCQVELQASAGGNALIGRSLYPLLKESGFGEVHVSPRMVYVDSSKPSLVEGFTRKTFTAMIEGVRTSALAAGLMSDSDFDQGITDLYRTAEADGVFCYTFFKATAVNNSKTEQGANDRRQILTTLRDEFNRWEALLAGLSEAQITAPVLADNWSIKDVIAHLRAWQQRSVARMEAAGLDREPEFPPWPADLDSEKGGQPHAMNAWLFASYRDQSWSRAHADWREGFLQFLELGEAIPEKDLLDPRRYSWLEGRPLSFILEASYEHHHEHAEYLEPLLARVRQVGSTQSAGKGPT